MNCERLDYVYTKLIASRDVDDAPTDRAPRFHVYESRSPPAAGGATAIKTPSSSGLYTPIDVSLVERFIDAYLDGMLRKSLFSDSKCTSLPSFSI